MANFVYRKKTIRRAGFLGLGKSNLAVLEYISRHFPDVEFTVRCEKITEPPVCNVKSLYFGSNMLNDIFEDVLFISPSARRDREEISKAKDAGVILSSDAEFFFDNTSSDIFSVTGSDGKSTTTYLASLLISSGEGCCLPIGNIGVAMTSVLDNPKNFTYAAELSSFQLMYMKPSCRRCVITNISKNHLNWHKSFEEYIGAKRNILENSHERIINYDCKTTRNLGHEFPLFAVFSNKYDEIHLRSEIKAEHYITRNKNFILADGYKILDTNDIKANGEHNILNFMAASALSLGICKTDAISNAAKSFSGLPHRCEYVGRYRGVDYYDSSIDSSPKRSAATLSSINRRVIIILGGRSKGLDFSSLIPSLEKKAKHIVLTGECAEEIENAILKRREFKKIELKYTIKRRFADAAAYAVSIAEVGDAVLLSPAATSYDEFSDFEARGETFKRIIKDITLEV